MRVFCRKSLQEHTAKIADAWFNISRRGISFFEKMFGTPFPFNKLDSVFCPDYR